MRIALLTWDFPPEPSGLGRAAHAVAMSLVEAGQQVVVFDASVPAGQGTSFDGLRVIGCGVAVDGFLRRRMGLGHLVAPHAFARALRVEHAREPFDLVEATNWYAPGFFLRNGPVPLVTRNSTPAIDALSSARSFRDRTDTKVAAALEAATVRACAGTISNTSAHAAMIAELYRLPDELPHAVIGLALDPAFLEAGREASLPSGDEAELLFIGRAERRKGFAEAVGAFALLIEAADDSGEARPRLTIVGPSRDDLDRLGLAPAVRDRITLVGAVSDEILVRTYARASLVLAPSRYESYGLVYREAAAFGRPLVACAEDPAARAFIAESSCGALADRCEPGPIAAVCRSLLADGARQKAYSVAGKAFSATLGRDALASGTLDLYARALARFT